MKSLPLNGIFSDTQIDLTIKKNLPSKGMGGMTRNFRVFLTQTEGSETLGQNARGIGDSIAPPKNTIRWFDSAFELFLFPSRSCPIMMID